MRRIALLVCGLALAVLPAATAGAATISNGTVSLGVNPEGDLNATDPASGQLIGVTYNPTGNDGTRQGLPAEGWGAGAAGPGQFEGRANRYAGTEGFRQVSFTSNASSAVSIVDVLDGETAVLRLRQDFHPSPTTPNLYEITTTLTNLTAAPLSGVRYERVMDWDVEPTATDEFVTINRGATPPSALIYSDDNGFGDTLPFSDRAAGTDNGPIGPADEVVNANYVDRGPADHGARFTFSFGTLAAGESRQFFLYYGAAGTEADADSAVSAAALEMYSYGQPNVPDGDDADTLPDGPAQGKPNTFIWGFRAVGGRPVIPPTLTLSPKAASGTTGTVTGVTATLRDDSGSPVPGAKLVFGVAGANAAGGTATTDGAGNAGFGYSGANAGDDTILACLDSNANGGCDAGEVADSASRHWDAPPPPVVEPPQPEQGKSVVAGPVSGTVKVKLKNGKFKTLGANESIPLGSTVDATKGRVRLTSAAGGGKTQTADFYKGQFKITQTKGKKPITQLELNGTLSCGGKASAAARKKKKVRSLWGDGKGRFRTKGRRAAATVRGTKWFTQDTCTSTKITVKRGVVQVRDFVKRKNVTVKKGHSYVARKKKRK
jgi:hypothetical protein